MQSHFALRVVVSLRDLTCAWLWQPHRAAEGMCLLGLLLQPGARVPLLLAHNRDEFFDRPAGAPDIAAAVLCGRDERGGGTWAGLNRASGVAVALTNAGRRARSPPGFLSRGTLVADVLCGRAAAAALSPAGLRAACARAGAGEAVRVALPGAVAGFNLIVVDTHELAAWYITNKPQKEALAHLPAADRAELLCGVDDHGLCELPPTAAVASRIAPGAHALSNSTLDDERWEKVAWLRAKLAALTSAPGTLVAADTAAAEGGGGGDDEDMRTLRALLEEVVPIFTHTGGLASEARMPDLRCVGVRHYRAACTGAAQRRATAPLPSALAAGAASSLRRRGTCRTTRLSCQHMACATGRAKSPSLSASVRRHSSSIGRLRQTRQTRGVHLLMRRVRPTSSAPMRTPVPAPARLS